MLMQSAKEFRLRLLLRLPERSVVDKFLAQKFVNDVPYHFFRSFAITGAKHREDRLGLANAPIMNPFGNSSDQLVSEKRRAERV